MELKFKSKSKKGKRGEIYYKKSRFYVSHILSKSPKTWSELTKSTGLHQIELKRILDDLLSSGEIKKIGDKYSTIEFPYWKYLNSPKKLKESYLKKINDAKIGDIHVFDPIILFPLNKTMFNPSEIEEIDKNCQKILESTKEIDNLIKENRKKFIKEKLEKEIKTSKSLFQKTIKKNLEKICLFIGSLGKSITTKDIRKILKTTDSEIFLLYKKFSYSDRSKFLNLIIKISKETERDFPIILSTIWI